MEKQIQEDLAWEVVLQSLRAYRTAAEAYKQQIFSPPGLYEAGYYADSQFNQAVELERIARQLKDSCVGISSEKDVLQIVEEMGLTRRSGKEYLERLFNKNGLRTIEVIQTGCIAWSVLQDSTGKKVKVRALTALSTKGQGGQVGFTFTPQVPDQWYAFIAQPWGRVFLMHIDEVQKSRRANRPKQKGIALTLSYGVHKFDFEERIQDLKESAY